MTAQLNTNDRRIVLLIACLALCAAVGCRRAAAPQNEEIRVTLVAPVFSPPAGDGRLTIRVADENDRPIDTAALQIRGDMADPGMVPIHASAAGGEDGLYRVPVYWTMAGEWIVTVETTLNDGRQTARTFDMTVTGEEELCTDQE